MRTSLLLATSLLSLTVATGALAQTGNVVTAPVDAKSTKTETVKTEKTSKEADKKGGEKKEKHELKTEKKTETK